jgi:hypothetical protein
MRANFKLIATGATLYAALVAILLVLSAVEGPARALGEADAWQRQMDIQQQMPQPQMPVWTHPSQPTWITPPAARLQPPQRLQTTCYLIGNILTCY